MKEIAGLYNALQKGLCSIKLVMSA